MIDIAVRYKSEITDKFYDIWFDEKYHYYFGNGFKKAPEIDEDSWNYHQFVSLNKDGEIIGFVSYKTVRILNAVSSLRIISFAKTNEDTIIFSKDLYNIIRDIFEKFKFNKINFIGFIGNPALEHYDKIIDNFGGRVVGIYKDDALDIDNSYIDTKLYEITRAEYLEHKKGNTENE